MRAGIAPIIVIALAGCASQADKQLEAVKSARSVLSEWALVEQQVHASRAQATYVEQMREMAKDQLRTASKGLTGQPAAAALIDRIRVGEPRAPELEKAAEALEPLEKRLEAA